MLNGQTWADFGITIPAGRTGELDTVCPQCSPHRRKPNVRCLSVNCDKGVAICHHCGWSVTLGSRPQHYEPAWRKPPYRIPEPLPAAPLPSHVLEWFADRGIPDHVLIRNHVTMARVYMPQLEDHAEVIVFPYRRDAAVVNHKYRTLDKHFRMDTGAERLLYKLDDVREDTTIIVEGEIDALSIEAAGFAHCLSVPDGAPPPTAKNYSGKFTFLDTAEGVLAPVKKFILAVDSDEPGRTLEEELARRLGRERCWRVVWPTGCKDANDVLVQHGIFALRDCIAHAEPYPIDGVFTALSESDKVRLLYRDGFMCGHVTGWKSLDQFYTVRPGEFTVVIGVPGSGKSNFVDALIVNLAELHGWGFAIFSPENQPLEDHMARMIEKRMRLPFSAGPHPRMDPSDLEDGIAWAGQHFWWMLPGDESSWNIEWILTRAKELVYRQGVRGLVIDPWNELEPQRTPHETETEYVSRVLRTVRQFARHHGVHVWMIAHPTKLYRNDEGKYPVPTLYDAAGSAHWRNKADNGICIWRDFTQTSRAIDVHIQKIRFRQIGKLGKVTLLYDAPTARYDEHYVEEVDHDSRRFGP